MAIVFCKFKSIYAVVKENELTVLESKVNKKLNEGWMLQGGISQACVSTGYAGGSITHYAQALKQEIYIDDKGKELARTVYERTDGVVINAAELMKQVREGGNDDREKAD